MHSRCIITVASIIVPLAADDEAASSGRTETIIRHGSSGILPSGKKKQSMHFDSERAV
jgi:hypothetical protein